jgi:uncharacterized protein (UPF0548 family)
MAEWRFARGWQDDELRERLAHAGRSGRNFPEPDAAMTAEHGWSRHYSRAVIAVEPPGPPTAEGPFARARPLLDRYAFSDPRIVKAHYDAASPLLRRVMLLEARVLGLRYLGPVTISAVRDERHDTHSVHGFRYDTLAGHFERGSEWFLVTKEHGSGEVTFTVHAVWKRGELPNVWSRIGFRLLVRRYQRRWHRLAHLRMRAMLGSVDLAPLPRGARLVHEGPALPDVSVQVTASGPPPEPIVTENETHAPRKTEVA